MTKNESTNPKDAIGRKKAPLHLIPSVALVMEAAAMRNGAEKYGPYNWRDKTVAATVYIAAAQRHLAAYLDGEDAARDSGVHHLAHARASLGILLDARAQGTLVDDRPTPGRAADLIEGATFNSPSAPPAPSPPEQGGQDLYYPDPDAPKPKRKVYIAGPMRGLPKYNFPAFDAARDLAAAKGWDPISPADLDRAHGVDENTPPNEAQSLASRRAYVERDVAALLSLGTDGAIALLPGWRGSTGATAEAAIAAWLGLQVLDATTMEPVDKNWVHDALYNCEKSDYLGKPIFEHLHKQVKP